MIKQKGEGKSQPSKNKKEEHLNFILNESLPKTQQERKKYVSDIAFFYNTIFKSKLEHFIGLELKELSIRGRSEDYYNFIRANIYCFGEIDKWMKERLSEHLGNMEGIRNSFDENIDIISNLKDKYGKN